MLRDYLEYEMLHGMIRYYKYLYYEKDTTEISDQEYDGLERRFNNLARHLGLSGSWVGCRDKPEVE